MDEKNGIIGELYCELRKAQSYISGLHDGLKQKDEQIGQLLAQIQELTNGQEPGSNSGE